MSPGSVLTFGPCVWCQEYLEARAQAIEDVESHIVELGQIFNRLATMIAEQRELVERCGPCCCC